mmetsp:Transcript_16946/g.30399  ORF Transcript_16946/g.30399 Transcript_16946/m.30399 type:complete len:92 (-) Transcript_16946:1097-1372(-)
MTRLEAGQAKCFVLHDKAANYWRAGNPVSLQTVSDQDLESGNLSGESPLFVSLNKLASRHPKIQHLRLLSGSDVQVPRQHSPQSAKFVVVI